MKLSIKKENPLKMRTKETRKFLDRFQALLSEHKRLLGSLVEKPHPEYDRRMRELQECEDRLCAKCPKLHAKLRPLQDAVQAALGELRSTDTLRDDRRKLAKIMKAMELIEEASAAYYKWDIRQGKHSVAMLCSFGREWERVRVLGEDRNYVVVCNENQIFAPPFMTLLEARRLQSHIDSNSNYGGRIYDVSGLKVVNGKITGRQIFDSAKEVHAQPVDWRE